MHYNSIIICVSVSVSLLLTVQCVQYTIRQTVNGPVEGVELTTPFGQKLHAFISIPYAKPPITGRDPYTGETVDRRFKVR